MKRRTPWKKSRTYGDIYGGRRFHKLSDNLAFRYHSLQRPVEGQKLPILIEENPSRDFFFPVSAAEFQEVLSNLPGNPGEGITHLWLRSRPASESVYAPLAQFICGSGVRVIVIYPWPVDGKHDLGKTKPSLRLRNEYTRFGGKLTLARGKWWVSFDEEALKRFYIECLFLHEVGHHVDWYRRYWSKANRQAVEAFADQYARELAEQRLLVE